MYLVSTGKTTVLSDFADLETRSSYASHPNGENVDFQFYARSGIFVEVNKKCGLEILRIKEKPNQKLQIQRVQKLTIENVYCVACANQSLEEMALGLSNGQVKLYNYKNSQFVNKFNAENIRNSVLYVDYNASDEYVASVFESGQINIYGIKTNTRIDTVNIDGNSTLARFHPTKRFHLSIASYKGTVTIYDLQTKRKIFNAIDSHAAPCRDLCMAAAVPDTLISVGYDCVINIFDTRRKTQPLQLSYCHPLSTVAMSDCGTYFCVGNLKGELSTFDMRNTKVCLATKKVHDCAVTRIAFVPNEGQNGAASFSSNQTATETNNLESIPARSSGDLRKSVAPNPVTATASRGHRDSFCDFLDFQANKGLEKISSRFAMRRDSFDWETLSRKPSNEEQRVSLFQTGSGLSSIGSANNSACDSFDSKLNGSSDNVNTKVRHKNTDDGSRHSSSLGSTAPLRDRNVQQLTDKLVQIQEEHSLQQQQPVNTSSGSNKENPNIDLELHILPADRNSTPNPHIRNSMGGNFKINSNGDMAKQIADLRTEMNARFVQLESEMKFTAETNKWHIFTQSSNLWNQQIDRTEEIRDALGILLQNDPFVNEFLRLKEENETLKAQLQQLSKK